MFFEDALRLAILVYEPRGNDFCLVIVVRIIVEVVIVYHRVLDCASLVVGFVASGVKSRLSEKRDPFLLPAYVDQILELLPSFILFQGTP